MTVEINSEGTSTITSRGQNTDGENNSTISKTNPAGINAETLKSVEFSFLDNKNICCGLCGEIVPYDQLMSDHLPNAHPEVLADSSTTMEEIPYEQWLQVKKHISWHYNSKTINRLIYIKIIETFLSQIWLENNLQYNSLCIITYCTSYFN